MIVKLLKKCLVGFLVFSFINMPCYAVNWVTITAENGKSADLDLDSIKMVVDTVEYEISMKSNDFTYINKLSTELYKDGSPTALVQSKKYNNEGILISSETYNERKYRELKSGTLQYEIFDVLSKDLSEKNFSEGQTYWKKYLKKQRKDINSKWKPANFKNYNKNFVNNNIYNEPVYINNIDLEIDKTGLIKYRRADDYIERLSEIKYLDALPKEYTAETFNLSVEMKYYKYAGAKKYTKKPVVTQTSPNSATVKIAKNSRPPIFGHIQYGLLSANNKLSDFFNGNYIDKLPLLLLPVVIVAGIFGFVAWIVCNLLFLLFGGDSDDL